LLEIIHWETPNLPGKHFTNSNEAKYIYDEAWKYIHHMTFTNSEKTFARSYVGTLAAFVLDNLYMYL
jgi:hypothetical protein